MERIAYGIAEIARATGLSASFIRLEIRRGRLRATKCGRRVLITTDEVRRYLSSGDADQPRRASEEGPERAPPSGPA